MSQKDFTAKLLGLEEVILQKVEENSQGLQIYLEMKKREQRCPECGCPTSRIHDYRVWPLRDLSLRGRQSTLFYKKRRYVCPHCGKRFAEPCSFAGKYQRFTYRVAQEILRQLHARKSCKQIAEDTHTSLSGVLRCMDLFPQGKPVRLPRVISIDEFKGNVDNEKFQCILTDPEHRRVFDVLPKRTVSELQDYFKDFPDRNQVQYVVMDMHRGFRDAAKAFFPNAQIVIDRFHVVRYCTWAMEDVRKRVQAGLSAENRRHFKRSRKLLLAHRRELSDEDKLVLTRMLDFSEELWQAYALKEKFYEFMDSPNRSAAAERLGEWRTAFHRLHLKEFDACARMLRNWKQYILNAFDVPYSNGFTEGCNNATKALKRVAFGFHRFRNLRTRILMTACSHPNT